MNREDKRNINNNSDKDYNLNVQMKVPELKKWSKDLEWPTDKRIDDIGRNHVDGEIYNKLDIYD